MKAVVMAEIGELTLDDVESPGIVDAGDVLVRVTKAAICGSDLHVLHGKIPGMMPGGVIGHEFTGVVEKVAEGVDHVAPGDRVVGSFLIPCGSCSFCAERAYNFCEDIRVLGYGLFFGDLAGAQAETVRVPNAALTLMRIPDELDDEQVLFAGDILSTAYYVNQLAGVGEGQVVAVQGCGPIGILAIEIAMALGAERVVAVDVVADRLDRARALGADTIDASGSNPGVALEELTGGGAHAVLDTAGGPPAVLSQAFDMVRPGGTVAVVGVYSDFEMSIPLNDLWLKGVQLKFGGTCPVPALWHDVVDLIAAGKIDPTTVITHRLPLSEALRGYELFASREALKVVLEVS